MELPKMFPTGSEAPEPSISFADTKIQKLRLPLLPLDPSPGVILTHTQATDMHFNMEQL